MTIDHFYEARRLMVDALASDLIGSEKDSVITEDPYNRFLTAILYPKSDSTPEATSEEAGPAGDRMAPDGDNVAEAVEIVDTPIALSHVRFPSSCGLSFNVAEESTTLTVEVWAARYHDEGGQWHREGVHQSIDLPIPSQPGQREEEVAQGLRVRMIHRKAARGARPITVALINDVEAPARGKRDGHAWYQVEMAIRCAEGFHDRPGQASSGLDDEDVRSNELLFRNVRNLATGHGCAAAWVDSDVVTEVRTTFLPTHEVHRADTAVAGVSLPMTAFTEDLETDRLHGLVAAYRTWIDQRQGEAAGLKGSLRAQADEHLRLAREASDRMDAGIQLLDSNPDARRAFTLMNRAMKQQRDKQEFIRTGKVPAQQSWRPFQMAFILMNLPGLTDPASEDRGLADLLWFPTGGGKTEAYLGLIGYAILHRRIKNPTHGGVSVLMRYTLRLLTLQQFERATGLICALEMIRRTELPDAVPVTIGLWVGQGATPNKLPEAKKALAKLARGEEIQTENPMQLQVCSWCGSELKATDYRVTATSLIIRCPNTACDFADGLPAYVIDEDVYAIRPSLVIGTVDKFAMMAWRAEAQSLFSTDGKHPRPDLIVQDELHLISGPLGTMVGLYETAVDAACSDGTTRPKIIASTATIRRATEQVRRVFDRGTRQFPPPGLDSSDSFFAVDAPREQMGTREYVGVMAQGATHTYLMVRVYAALLQAASEIEATDEVRDAYWTLMGYFNSLRVLGGASIQVSDDVPAHMRVIAQRHERQQREIGEPSELTSRIPSSEVPKRLRELGWTIGDGALDTVLATNMISVGLDVDRLGLMAVMGQPQATAEYIQATSRVGRRNPGLVVVVYNSARSRDLSHYEGFATYHRTLYRQVEPNSATPFSPRARDRGLHGCLVSLARSNPALTADTSVSKVAQDATLLDGPVEAIVGRVRSVSPDQEEATKAQLDLLRDAWEGKPTLSKYAGWRNADDALLKEVAPVLSDNDAVTPIFPVDDPAWGTLTSLRDVDAVSSLYVISEKGTR